ncbi:transmembrane protein 40 [Candoia aspera]|uniref:transmembrane protein 40 n=1 Tax=Candoia aspera TaxID=51853 RepID=UPI002FD8551D
MSDQSTTTNGSDSAASLHEAKQQGRKPKPNKKTEVQEESEDESSLGELTESQTQDVSSEVVPYTETENTRTEETPAVVCENDICHSTHPPRWWIPMIRKDDEFFHFVIVCFSTGMSLVCNYKYNNWTVSCGIGLMTFAALETTGIYFGLVHRIRSVLEAFIPLIQRVKIPGFKKLN